MTFKFCQEVIWQIIKKNNLVLYKPRCGLWPQQNSKHEFLNPKQIQMTKNKNSKQIVTEPNNNFASSIASLPRSIRYFIKASSSCVIAALHPARYFYETASPYINLTPIFACYR